MSLARQQSGRWIEPDPTRTRQIDFAPRVQIGEIGGGSGWPVECFDIGRELDQITGHETRRETQMSQQLHQQPAGVATRSRLVRQRDLRRLHAGFQANQISDVALQALVQRDEEISGLSRRARHVGEIRGKLRRARQFDQVRCEFACLFRGVSERELLGRGFEKEIERIMHRHFRDQVNFDA